jgi:hypothetical protein
MIVESKKIFRTKIVDPTNNTKIVIMYYKGKFTKKEIRVTVQEISNQLKNKKLEGEIATDIYFGKDQPVKWGFSEWTAFGDKIDLYTHTIYEDTYEEPKFFKEFKILIRKF